MKFCSVFTNEDTPNMPSLDPSPYPDMPPITATTAGIAKLLRNLNPRKAAGPDGIPCRLLQCAAEEIAPALTLLYNRSLESGEVPSAWRHALVQPVFKKGDRTVPGNYRPISLTSVCGKLLEHVIRSAITQHFDQHAILADAQHGFRKSRSCETQLILTVDDLASSLDGGGQTDVILLDFSKAFDKVPHERLLMKLDHLGIRGSTLKWIENFLTDRTQQVVVEGQKSDVGRVTSGVPQGSVLGPTLFLAYINDIGSDIKSTVRLFADDTALYRDIKSQSDAQILQDDLNTLEHWETTWQMSFNVEKCHLLSVTRQRNPLSTSYSLHNQQLTSVNSAKYLGVEISRDLQWTRHVNAVAAKANRTSAFAYRNLRGCPHTVHSTCFKGLVRPTLEYASPVWDPHYDKNIETLEKVQKRAARRIHRDYRTTSSVTSMLSNLKLPPLSERRSAQKAMMMHKIIYGHADLHPRPGTLLPATHSRRGHGMKLQVPYSRTNTHLFSFFPSAIRLWNSLPAAAVQAATPTAFKSALEGWLRV